MQCLWTCCCSPNKLNSCCLQGLQMFGTGFLSRFEASQCPSKLLDEITLVDTPGVLSGEKQRVERQYDFIGVWYPWNPRIH